MRVYPIVYTAGHWKIWLQCLSKGKCCVHPESEVYKTTWSLSRMDLAWGHQITYYLPPLNLRTIAVTNALPPPLPLSHQMDWEAGGCLSLERAMRYLFHCKYNSV